MKCLFQARRVSGHECVFGVSILPLSLPCFDWIWNLDSVLLLLLVFIVIINLICSDNSNTLSFFFLPFYCLSFDFSFLFPIWYLQTSLNSILNSRSLRLTYKWHLLYYDLYFICLYLWIVFSLVFRLLHCIKIMKP